MWEKTQKLTLLQNWKTKIVIKLKNFNCNKTEKRKLRPNSNQSLKNFRNWNWDKNLTTQNVTKLNTSTYDKTQNLIKRTISDKNMLLRTTWHLNNQWDVFKAAICNLAMFFFNENFVLLFVFFFILSFKFKIIMTYWYLTRDSWHVTGDTWYGLCDVTHKVW